MKKQYSDAVLNEVIADQVNELVGHYVYKRLAQVTKDPENRKILERIAAEELSHYQTLKKYSEKDVKKPTLRIFFYTFTARIFGLTFALKLLENAENQAHMDYRAISEQLPKLIKVMQDEERHERELLAMIDEKRLNYMGSVVLGLNDALVELTGALAGFTFAIQKSQTIALMGIITGISATFSMAASEYLSKTQEEEGNALSASVYTGVAYLLTVVALILPFLIFSNPFLDLILTIFIAILIILIFNYYISVAKDLPFKKRFFQMAGISVSVAGLSFLIGWAVRVFLGLEI